MHFIRLWLISIAVLMAHTAAASCPQMLQQEMKVLNSPDVINLCERFANKPLLIINTASYCGYTPQFKQLEALYQQYKQSGIEFIGVASNSFNQEDSNEGKTADVCYINYGVSFTMLAPVAVKGEDAHPLFKQLAAQSQAPAWNFNKYLVDSNGKVIAYYPSSQLPSASDFEKVLSAKQD